MKVFVSMSCPHGELEGLQIFSTLEKAKAYSEKQNEHGFGGASEWYEAEYELDVEKKN